MARFSITVINVVHLTNEYKSSWKYVNALTQYKSDHCNLEQINSGI